MKIYNSLILILVVLGLNNLSAQNPIVRNQFSADPDCKGIQRQSICFSIARYSYS